MANPRKALEIINKVWKGFFIGIIAAATYIIVAHYCGDFVGAVSAGVVAALVSYFKN